MIDLASIPLGYRLLIATGVMIGPTLLFLGLCRFLEWLRDDQAIERVAQHEEYLGSLEPTPGDVVAGIAGLESGASVIRCQHCGAATVPEASTCLECGKSPS